MTITKRPLLSVATVAGAQRRRAQQLLEALAAQTTAADLEVVVVDVRPSMADLSPPPGLAVKVVASDASTFAQARAEAARISGGKVVAFIEDHCHPEPGWAEALERAYRQPWASVGYAIGNANPQRYRGRATYWAEYGEWEFPRPGPTQSLPANNVSYRRDLLLGFGRDLETMLVADYNVHAWLRRNGYALALEPGARARHQNFERFSDAVRVAFAYSRGLATERARIERWGRRRRLRRALTILASSPLARLGRLVGVTARRPSRLLRLALHLPGILSMYLASALGESAGYVFGHGADPGAVLHWEVDVERRAGR